MSDAISSRWGIQQIFQDCACEILQMIISSRRSPLRNLPELILPLCVVVGALLLGACETGTRALPAYETPLAKSGFQTVRLTAYTDTESDHREFSNHNALGGELHAAGTPIRSAENIARATPVSQTADVNSRVSDSGVRLQPFSLEPERRERVATSTPTFALPRSAVCGSAAADWSRWPAGTVFRLLSTGQIYRVDDYGWALAGRNTIDLYMGNQREMNNWGTRQEAIEILYWGDQQESLRLLRSHQNFKHIRRMVHELEGRPADAASLR